MQTKVKMILFSFYTFSIDIAIAFPVCSSCRGVFERDPGAKVAPVVLYRRNLSEHLGRVKCSCDDKSAYFSNFLKPPRIVNCSHFKVCCRTLQQHNQHLCCKLYLGPESSMWTDSSN